MCSTSWKNIGTSELIVEDNKKISGSAPTKACYHLKLKNKPKESISDINSLGKNKIMAAGGIDYDERKRKIEK